MFVNYMDRELNAKVALIGPAGSGKRSAMEVFRPFAPPRGKVQWTDRARDALAAGAVFFDFVPPKPAMVEGFAVRIHLYSTMPPDGPAALDFALEDADAILFVADSENTRRADNIAALLRLKERGGTPDVFLFNKRDRADIASVEDLALELGAGELPAFEGTATEKIGVAPAVKAAVACALRRR